MRILILLALVLAAAPAPLRADPPEPLPLDGDALHGCLEVVDTGEAGSDAQRALCAGAAAEPCIAEQEDEAGIAACLDAERAIWEQEAAGWVALVAGVLPEAERDAFALDAASRLGAGPCLSRWSPGRPGHIAPLARCRLQRAAEWLDELGRLYRTHARP